MREDANNRSPSQRHKSFISAFGLIEAGAVLVCLLTLTGFLGSWFWMFELTSHFRVQYAVLLGLTSMVVAFRRKWRGTLLFATFAIINGCLLIPFIPSSDKHSEGSTEPIRLLTWNVNSRNTRFDELSRLVSDHKPDLVLVLEANGQWVRHIQGLTHFPRQTLVPREDNFGIALATRSDSAVSETLHLGEAGVPSIHTSLSLSGKRISILGTHPLPPAGFRYSRLRDEQIDRIAEWVNARTNAVIVVGDLNITPWSPVFADFMERTDLVNSAEGRGLQGTWPGGFPPMMIPIDYFLHSTNIVVTRREILKASGSDHSPLLVEFRAR